MYMSCAFIQLTLNHKKFISYSECCELGLHSYYSGGEVSKFVVLLSLQSSPHRVGVNWWVGGWVEIIVREGLVKLWTASIDVHVL